MRHFYRSPLVVMTDPAEATNDSGWCQSSACMMPAIVTRTHSDLGGWLGPVWRRCHAYRVQAGVLGGDDALEQFGAPAADDHGVALGLQLNCELQADSAGGAE